jgi:hypothetical protein
VIGIQRESNDFSPEFLRFDEEEFHSLENAGQSTQGLDKDCRFITSALPRAGVHPCSPDDAVAGDRFDDDSVPCWRNWRKLSLYCGASRA